MESNDLLLLYNKNLKTVDLLFIFSLVLVIVYFYNPIPLKPRNKFFFKMILIFLIITTVYKKIICTKDLLDINDLFTNEKYLQVKEHFMYSVFFSVLLILFSFFVCYHVF
jgi:hypothetical protein